MEYSPLKEEYLYDVAVKLYGDFVLGVEKILYLNPEISLDSDLFGVTITYTEEPGRNKPVFVAQERNLTESYNARYLQSIYDLSVQLYGDLSGLADILTAHQQVDNTISVGTSFTAPKTTDPRVQYFKDRRIILQTDIGEIGNFMLTEDGFFLVTESGEKIDI